MKRLGIILFMCGLLLDASPAQKPPLPPSELQHHLLVVYNENNRFARELAYLYANLRNIPSKRILAIRCPDREVIPRNVFNEQIRSPIVSYLQENDWIEWTIQSVNYYGVNYTVELAKRNDIWSIVLIRGIPLKISRDQNVIKPPQISEAFAPNESAVDSELAALTVEGLPPSALFPNPYFDQPPDTAFNQNWSNQLILVTRLDAPLPGQVEQMIRQSVEIENQGLAGNAVFDARGITDQAYRSGDEWILNSAQSIRNLGFPTYLDEEGPVIPLHEPLSDVALYAGWYTKNAGGFVRRDDFQFRPGAVAYHIHSYSASTIRMDDQNWVAPLLGKGAAAVMGSVYEPYLQFTPHIDRFVNALTAGRTFAEAAYLSQPALSWMITMIGDPLYRPFATGFGLRDSAALPSDTRVWLRDRRARTMAASGTDYPSIRDMLVRDPDPLLWETLADLAVQLSRQPDETLGAFQQAIRLAPTPTAKIRTRLKLARYLAESDNPGDALSQFETILREHPDWPGLDALALEAGSLAEKAKIRDLPPLIAESYQQQLEDNAAEADSDDAPPKTPPPNAPFPEAPSIQARKDLIPKQPSFSPPQPKPNSSGRLTPENDPNRHHPGRLAPP